MTNSTDKQQADAAYDLFGRSSRKGLSELKQLAYYGNADAIFWLYYIYANGLHNFFSNGDLGEALKWLHQGVKYGASWASAEIANNIYAGISAFGSPENCVEAATNAIDIGEMSPLVIKSIGTLSACYDSGFGCSVDIQKYVLFRRLHETLKELLDPQATYSFPWRNPLPYDTLRVADALINTYISYWRRNGVRPCVCAGDPKLRLLDIYIDTLQKLEAY